MLLVCGLSMDREYDVVRVQEREGGCASDSDSELWFSEWPAYTLSASVPRQHEFALSRNPMTDPLTAWWTSL